MLEHQTHRESLYKFILLLIVLAGYFIYLGWQYGFATGGLVAALTWSFFVLCTPVADAGFLLDFPVRLITNLRMWMSELGVWTVAISINVVTLQYAPEVYDKTHLTSLLHKIIVTPWPYWGIFVVCASGTFLSVRFGDEMMDVMSHKDRKIFHQHGFKYQLIAIVGFTLLILWGYYHLIEALGITIPE